MSTSSNLQLSYLMESINYFPGITRDNVKELGRQRLELFNQYDINKDNKVDEQEISRDNTDGLKYSGRSKEDIEKMILYELQYFDELDKNKDGILDRKECPQLFLTDLKLWNGITREQAEKTGPETLECFNKADANGDGKLDEDEIFNYNYSGVDSRYMLNAPEHKEVQKDEYIRDKKYKQAKIPDYVFGGTMLGSVLTGAIAGFKVGKGVGKILTTLLGAGAGLFLGGSLSYMAAGITEQNLSKDTSKWEKEFEKTYETPAVFKEEYSD